MYDQCLIEFLRDWFLKWSKAIQIKTVSIKTEAHKYHNATVINLTSLQNLKHQKPRINLITVS